MILDGLKFESSNVISNEYKKTKFLRSFSKTNYYLKHKFFKLRFLVWRFEFSNRKFHFWRSYKINRRKLRWKIVGIRSSRENIRRFFKFVLKNFLVSSIVVTLPKEPSVIFRKVILLLNLHISLLLARLPMILSKSYCVLIRNYSMVSEQV